MAKVSVKTALSRVLFLMYLVCIAFVCFMSSSSVPKMSVTLLGLPTDKIIHFLMFLPFPILFYLSFDHKKSGFLPSLGFATIALVLGCGIAAGTELIQGLLPTRAKDLYDFLADSSAVLCSSLLVLILDNTKGRRR